MRYLYCHAIFLLLVMASRAYPQDIIEIIGEGTIDVGNVFRVFEPADIEIPSAIAHPYHLRITYTLIKGITAELKMSSVPERTYYGEWWDEITPAHIHTELSFAHPNMEIRWDLVDARTSEIFATVRDHIAIELSRNFDLNAEPNLAGQQQFSFKTLGYPPLGTPDHVRFPLLPSDPGHYIVSFQRDYVDMSNRFQYATVKLKSIGAKLYQLEGMEFDQELLRHTYWLSGPSFDVDYARLRFYYGLGAPGHDHPSFQERLISGPFNDGQ